MLDKVVVQENKDADFSIIWLHGLGADGHDFESIIPELQLPKTAKVRFIFPHAPVRKVTVNAGYPMRAWYDISSDVIQRSPDIQGMEESVIQVGELIQNEIKMGIPQKKIIIAGFSQGGAIALLTGLKNPQFFAGILALSTYLPDVQYSKEVNSETPYLMMHGTFDAVVPLDLAKDSYRRLQGLGLSTEWYEYPMAHSLCQEQIIKISEWLKQKIQ